jgi:hypothetical protein
LNEAKGVVMFGMEDGLSFSSGSPSAIKIDALEDSEVFQIDKSSL